jgi:hypothetical protein
MNYNNGGLFGYDQIFVGPLCESYKDYDRKSIKSNTNLSDRLADHSGQHVRGRESFANYRDQGYDPGYDRLSDHGGQHVRGRANFTGHYDNRNCNSVHDYLNNAAMVGRDAENKREAEFIKVKKKLYGYKYRHDMMFLFITCLFIIIIIQYSVHMNTISSMQWHRQHAAYMPLNQSPTMESPYIA